MKKLLLPLLALCITTGCTYAPRCTQAERQKLIERSAAVPPVTFTDAPMFERDANGRADQLRFNIARFNAVCTKG